MPLFAGSNAADSAASGHIRSFAFHYAYLPAHLPPYDALRPPLLLVLPCLM